LIVVWLVPRLSTDVCVCTRVGSVAMSLKHVVHKRVHKERHQPEARAKLGYLEKHKDYVKRAKDYHRKEDAIKKMHQKAYFKNEEEFSFKMLSHAANHNQGGRLTKTKEHLKVDELKLLDSQDARYIAMREQMDKKAIQRQTEKLHFLDAAGKAKQHVLFLDDEDELGHPASPSVSSSSVLSASLAVKGHKKRKLQDYDVAAHFGTHPSLVGRRSNRLRLDQLEKGAFTEPSYVNAQAYRELYSRQERAKKLGRVREELDLRSHLRTKGKRMKVADGGKDKPAVFKWFPDRKR